MKNYNCQFCQQQCAPMDVDNWMKCCHCKVTFGFADDKMKIITFYAKVNNKWFELIINFNMNKTSIWKYQNNDYEESQEWDWVRTTLAWDWVCSFMTIKDITPFNVYDKLKLYLTLL